MGFIYFYPIPSGNRNKSKSGTVTVTQIQNRLRYLSHFGTIIVRVKQQTLLDPYPSSGLINVTLIDSSIVCGYILLSRPLGLLRLLRKRTLRSWYREGSGYA
jgi:hypothetical protein